MKDLAYCQFPIEDEQLVRYYNFYLRLSISQLTINQSLTVPYLGVAHG